MSISNILFSTGVGVSQQVLNTVLIKQGRNIAGIYPDVVIKETHLDELDITQHPIQKISTTSSNTPISDNAFKRPVELTMVVGWSDASQWGASLGALSNVGQTVYSQVSGFSNTGGYSNGASSYLKGVYNNMLALQASLIPMSVVTGKRTYTNMMIERIECDTDADTENVVILTIHFKEVIIVTTSATNVISPQVGTISNDKITVNTAPVNAGTKQLGTAVTNPVGVPQ